ncbi:YbhB/YbcL family Raf kinase inhibitor-like protein [Agrobacterium vitis]|uniref:YbhB/YbcL family Raf kinase inhibitor-like protein n=1 Tax=Agrobacterium vitis TaxID=373 RepID=UPI0018D22F68|nr:YbhB/YbcL family Raf kinase inhibitor-like protein [Agrobacterium vitis]
MSLFFRRLHSSMVTSVILVACSSASAQEKIGKHSDITIRSSVLEPEKIEVSNDAELAGLLKVPEGFKIEVYARDLINPRMLAVSDDGTLYASRRAVGDIIMLKDKDGDGRAEEIKTAASRPGMHGIAFDGKTVFLATVNDVYKADIQDDGSFGELSRIINDLPDAGQHPNRTLAVGPDDMLYISAGSTCNACDESNPENATLLRAKKDGTSRSIFSSGLRNTIGFDWEPSSGALYGVDHGIDWLGDEEQVEELNRLEQGKQYGWPYIHGMGKLNPQDNPPEGVTLEQWAKLSTRPELAYTAHSAPMQMAFYDGQAFPAAYQGDAFVAMRGSWNRRPPSGYEVARINFEDGKPVAFEHFLEGFLIQKEGGGYGVLGRPTGIAVGKDGALFVADDTNGVIYRVTSDIKASASVEPAVDSDQTAGIPNVVKPIPPSKVAFDLISATSEEPIDVKAGFGNHEAMPGKTSADGDNASPMLSWSGVPEGTKSFVLISDDPDADEPKPFVHWIAYDVPASVAALREGLPTDPVLVEPKGMKQGTNSMGSHGYTGPKPPVGDPAHKLSLPGLCPRY